MIGPDGGMRLSDLARAVLVLLTHDGLSTHRAVDQARAADVEDYLGRLDTDEQATLARLLNRLVDDPAG